MLGLRHEESINLDAWENKELCFIYFLLIELAFILENAGRFSILSLGAGIFDWRY